MIERCCGKDCMELSTTELVRKGEGNLYGAMWFCDSCSEDMDEDLIAINTAAKIVEEALNDKRD